MSPQHTASSNQVLAWVPWYGQGFAFREGDKCIGQSKSRWGLLPGMLWRLSRAGQEPQPRREAGGSAPVPPLRGAGRAPGTLRRRKAPVLPQLREGTTRGLLLGTSHRLPFSAPPASRHRHGAGFDGALKATAAPCAAAGIPVQAAGWASSIENNLLKSQRHTRGRPRAAQLQPRPRSRPGAARLAAGARGGQAARTPRGTDRRIRCRMYRVYTE